MIMATWRGSLSGGIFRGVFDMNNKTVTRSGSYLHFHDLGFFSLTVVANFFHIAVGQLLKFSFAAFEFVLRDQFFLFEIAHIVMGIAADVADGDPRLLKTM